VISQYDDDDIFKVGLARGVEGLYSRVKSYAIGMPYSDELWVQYMVICFSIPDAIEFEKHILQDKSLDKIEKHPSKGALEWRLNANYYGIQQSIINACIHKPNLWQKIIVFGRNGWKVVSNNDRHDKKYTKASFKLEKPPDDYTGKTNVYGTTEIVQPKKKKVKVAAVKPVPLKPIVAPTGDFDKYTEDVAGRYILYKWDSDKESDRGWFKGHILKRRTTLKERKKGLNYNVKYTKKATNGKIVGIVATELTKANYGTKWFLKK
jgi:hypothetical protein